MKVKSLLGICLIALLAFGCRSNSPEDLPKLKAKFKSQISSFEKMKDKTNDVVGDGLEGLSGLPLAIKEARDVDKEFNKVYGNWEKVDKRVNNLFKEYESLKTKANDLFSAIERQVASLNNEDNKRDLLKALGKSQSEYDVTLAKTETAINKLRGLHTDALDVIKALEAAVAIGQISEINEGLKNIESRVDEIMMELNQSIDESKELYEKKIGAIK